MSVDRFRVHLILSCLELSCTDKLALIPALERHGTMRFSIRYSESIIGNSLNQFLVACCFLGLISPIQAQPSALHSDVLALPVVISGEQFFRVSLQLLSDTDPVELEISTVDEILTANTTGASYFNNGVLSVPELLIENQSYWAEFSSVNSSRLRLAAFGINNFGLDTNQLAQTSQPNWQRLPGEAADIGIGANGSVWIIGLDESHGGYRIYHWNGQNWRRVEGSAVRIDVDPAGNPWIVNQSHEIYRWRGDSWQRLPGDARDIGIGANGAVWVASGGGVFRWNGVGWDRTSGSAVRIDVDAAGNPWVIDHTDDIYQLRNGRWQRVSGQARDIGIGADGSVWITGTRDGGGGHDVFRWNGSGWNQVPGSARQISVDPFGVPWVLGSAGKIYRGQ